MQTEYAENKRNVQNTMYSPASLHGGGGGGVVGELAVQAAELGEGVGDHDVQAAGRGGGGHGDGWKMNGGIGLEFVVGNSSKYLAF